MLTQRLVLKYSEKDEYYSQDGENGILLYIISLIVVIEKRWVEQIQKIFSRLPPTEEN